MAQRETRRASAPANSVQTSDRCFIAKESGEPSKMGKQMTAHAGAPVDDAERWRSIDWTDAHREVRRLQMRIAKAVKEGRWNRVRILQYLLTRSCQAPGREASDLEQGEEHPWR